MKKAQRNLLGIVTAMSVVLTSVVLWWIFVGDPTESSNAMNLLSAFIIFHGVLFWIYYRNVFRNPNVPDGSRNAWSIAIFLGLAFAQFVYYWTYIWKPSAQSRALTS